ncbi:BREX-1 system phosphatase PglZ type A [Clostridium sp. DJ247]|uniref:BREX-1 system phosphatase PglZ type A n=1 Tax=Clostridium sp. DJ247 TaxID=2726188 RepID=UPI00162A994E|nr:BREX-1 system phosphatase PglZ type A [Clostridium sp. DJ247]MBC2579370.1 BREX-1 system phosphatase PglZ type A [Clostridium sp. DJ247]
MDYIDKLKEKFSVKDNRNIVFWYDTNSSRDIDLVINELFELGVKLWEIKENNTFQTRCQLEIIDKSSDYLLYANFQKPNNRENPLIDILLYSQEFSADDIALIINRYGLEHLNVREFISNNIRFFNDKKRCKKLEEILTTNPSMDQLALGMLCVLTGTNSLRIEEVVKVTLTKELDETNDAIKNISKLYDIDSFWDVVYNHFGIKYKDRSLEILLNTLIYCNLNSNIGFTLPADFKYIYESSAINVCNIFFEDLIKSNDKNKFVLNYLANIESKWQIEDIFIQQSYLNFYRCSTFKVIDKLLMKRFIEEIVNETANYDSWKKILDYRNLSIWIFEEKINNYYEILNYSLKLYNEKQKFKGTYMPKNASEWVNSYFNQQYNIDKIYRNLVREYTSAGQPDFFFTLVQHFSEWYSNYFLDKLAQWTDTIIKNELSENWNIDKLLNQFDFYNKKIKPLIDKTSEKVFVIISDAFRYECAKELEEKLRDRINSKVEVMPALATIPSYTQLGMAALLPGVNISIDDKGVVYKDDISTKGLENRNKILKKNIDEAIALSLPEFMSLKISEGQELIKGKRLVYLYHDRIDATGDSFKSEGYTYEVVSDAIDELKSSLLKLIGSYSAVRIFVTSDHGFIYQTEKIDEKYKAISVEGTVVDGNKRFAIGKGLSIPEGSNKVNMNYIGISLDTVITSRLNRFKSKGGGLRFVHGGAMPQEVIIPVLSYKEIRGQNRKKEEQRVSIIITNERIITNYNFKVIFFQEQKVDSNYGKRSLKAAFYQGENRISNEINITFDSDEEANKRVNYVSFIIQEKSYKIGEIVVLRLEDIKDNSIYKDVEYEMRIYDSF